MKPETPPARQPASVKPIMMIRARRAARFMVLKAPAVDDQARRARHRVHSQASPLRPRVGPAEHTLSTSGHRPAPDRPRQPEPGDEIRPMRAPGSDERAGVLVEARPDSRHNGSSE